MMMYIQQMFHDTNHYFAKPGDCFFEADVLQRIIIFSFLKWNEQGRVVNLYGRKKLTILRTRDGV